ncbi:hypothetical protein [Burkholderia ambifaria]|uniref:hypothetical protein n=1 Tax=Burkholderia ambifaria TaxID=152480 RepID=UPI000AEE6F05|nr:hypothetical protein [Burkholderia ambifaria]
MKSNDIRGTPVSCNYNLTIAHVDDPLSAPPHLPRHHISAEIGLIETNTRNHSSGRLVFSQLHSNTSAGSLECLYHAAHHHYASDIESSHDVAQKITNQEVILIFHRVKQPLSTVFCNRLFNCGTAGDSFSSTNIHQESNNELTNSH